MSQAHESIDSNTATLQCRTSALTLGPARARRASRASRGARKKPGIAGFTRYGDFSADHTEFIIRDPNTPRPWVNYLSNGKYCLILSQAGGGYSWHLDPGLRRITRWLPESYLKDTPGRAIYIRDAETGKFWTTSYRPVEASDRYECRHGLGYTTLINEFAGIRSEVTHFVPEGASHEVWLAKLTNRSARARRLQLFPFVEWLAGDWMDELKVRNIAILVNEGWFDQDNNVLIARKFPWAGKPYDFLCFMGGSLPVKGYDVDLEKFIGRYRDYANPQAVERGVCGRSRVRGVNMAGVLQHELELEAGEEKEFVIVVGLAESKEDPRAISAAVARSGKLVKAWTVAAAKRSLAETKRRWREAIVDNNVLIETPDTALNQAVNVWMKYQITMNNHWGRSATYYHEGAGEFGYRNTAQDAWSMVPLNPAYARDRLIFLCEHQWKTGQPMPGWSLISGPSTHRPPSDFPIWLPMLLIAYVKETGDLDILKKKVRYHDGGSATVYEHAKKATEFLQDIARSPRGIPLMGTQDWNDAFDRTGIRGRGESVWLGMGLCVALKNLEELAERIRDSKTAADCRKRYTRMKEILNRHAWDGSWYCYAFNDDGKPIGSRRNKEGRIQLNAQTWAIIAGLPDPAQLKKILKVIDHDLATPFGPALFTPPYTEHDGTIGRITDFAPGTKENAAIFCHGGAFKIFADLRIGRAEEAYDTTRRILPSAANKDIEIYKTEPYVFAEYLIGPGNPCYGEGAFTWLTGSVDWVFIAVTQEMLGVRPDYDGLRVEPCLPKAWKEARVTRQFRGSTYDIRIRNPRGVSRGVRSISIDGKAQEGTLIRPHADGKTHRVEVVLG